jgi:uncharacterized protein YjbI with pentapeptide repeats
MASPLQIEAQHACFRKAALFKASLRQAKLRHADFTDAILVGANFSEYPFCYSLAGVLFRAVVSACVRQVEVILLYYQVRSQLLHLPACRL